MTEKSGTMIRRITTAPASARARRCCRISPLRRPSDHMQCYVSKVLRQNPAGLFSNLYDYVPRRRKGLDVAREGDAFSVTLFCGCRADGGTSEGIFQLFPPTKTALKGLYLVVVVVLLPHLQHQRSAILLVGTITVEDDQ